MAPVIREGITKNWQATFQDLNIRQLKYLFTNSVNAKPMNPEPDKKNEKLWNLAFHEDGRFDSRLQSFLTAHTFMLTAAGFMLSKDNPSTYIPQVDR